MFRTRSDEVDFSASPQIPLFISSIGEPYALLYSAKRVFSNQLILTAGVKKQRIEETHEDGSIKLIEEVESLTNTGQVLHSLHQANSLEKQILLLQRLYKLEGLDYATDFAHPDGRKATVRELINEVYYKAGAWFRFLLVPKKEKILHERMAQLMPKSGRWCGELLQSWAELCSVSWAV